jgi:hypothetical protein
LPISDALRDSVVVPELDGELTPTFNPAWLTCEFVGGRVLTSEDNATSGLGRDSRSAATAIALAPTGTSSTLKQTSQPALTG